MSRLSTIISDGITIKTGVGGNVYAMSTSQPALVTLCEEIGKSPYSIYYSVKHSCYAIRTKAKHHRMKLHCM